MKVLPYSKPAYSRCGDTYTSGPNLPPEELRIEVDLSGAARSVVMPLTPPDINEVGGDQGKWMGGGSGLGLVLPIHDEKERLVRSTTTHTPIHPYTHACTTGLTSSHCDMFIPRARQPLLRADAFLRFWCDR